MDAIGHKGGLAILWDEKIDVRIVLYSPGHIDCQVTSEDGTWRFTGFYGNPVTEPGSYRGNYWKD